MGLHRQNRNQGPQNTPLTTQGAPGTSWGPFPLPHSLSAASTPRFQQVGGERRGGEARQQPHQSPRLAVPLSAEQVERQFPVRPISRRCSRSTWLSPPPLRADLRGRPGRGKSCTLHFNGQSPRRCSRWCSDQRIPTAPRDCLQQPPTHGAPDRNHRSPARNTFVECRHRDGRVGRTLPREVHLPVGRTISTPHKVSPAHRAHLPAANSMKRSSHSCGQPTSHGVG